MSGAATQDLLAGGNIEAFLAATVPLLDPEAPAPRRSRGRPRILPSLCLWTGVLVCCLRGQGLTQRAVWRLLSVHGLWHYPRFLLSDQAITKRLVQEATTDGPSPLERLFVAVRDHLRTRLAPAADLTLAPFASEVFAIDESTLDPLARRLPTLKAPGAERLPGKLTAVFDLRRQLWRQVQLTDKPHQNEKVAAWPLLTLLPHNCLLVVDLGYWSYAWFDAVIAGGYHVLSRLRSKSSYRIVHRFSQNGDTLDALIFLGAHRSDRGRHLRRLIQFRTPRGRYRYITSQTDPHLLPLSEVARVYQHRWDLELAFDLIKRHLGLHLFWSSSLTLVQAQVWAVLIISMILQALRLEVAHQAGVTADEVSLPLLIAALPRFLADGVNPLERLAIDGRRAGIIRPTRRTPNAAPLAPLEAYLDPPPDLLRERVPRHAHRRCAPRSVSTPIAK